MALKIASIGLSLLTAFASSLCCIAPILAIVAGTSSLTANFAWIEPFRPYFMVATVGILGLAWYQKLTSKPAVADCCVPKNGSKNGFLQSTKFLGIVTFFALFLTAFPYFSNGLMAKTKATSPANAAANRVVERGEFSVTGMTCEGCEHHITSKVSELKGIINVAASYEKGSTTVEFDPNQVTINDIKAAIDSTGYSSDIIKKQ
jgi:mercuric ion transport protein